MSMIIELWHDTFEHAKIHQAIIETPIKKFAIPTFHYNGEKACHFFKDS